MKISTSFLLLILFSLSFSLIDAQSLTPSTVRQVFSLEKGDSLEYHEWTSQLYPGCAWVVCDRYKLKVVDTVYYNPQGDTLYIAFTNALLYFDTASQPASCGQCQTGFWVGDPFNLDLTRWIATSLDSSIERYLDTLYRPGGVVFIGDSSYSDSAIYNGAKQNRIEVGYMIMDATTDIYADSLGITYKWEDHQMSFRNNEQLVYYHKANGKTWGTRYINTGVKELSTEYNISIYPNPSDGKFTIKMEHYQSGSFELSDMLGRKVLSLILNTAETEVNRNSLPSGFYDWQIVKGGQPIKTGKLIVE